MRAVNCGRSKSVYARRAYVCFLEREVYAFLMSGFAAQCCGPAFFLFMEGRRGRRWIGRRWVAGGTCEELVGRATQEERHAKTRETRKESCFLFLEERPEGVCLSSGWKQR